MNKQIMILSTCFRPNIGGVETHLDDLIKAGYKKKIKFNVITYQPLVTNTKGKYKEKGKNFIIYRIPWFRFNLFLKLVRYPFFEFIYLFPGLFFGSFVYLSFNNRYINNIHAQGLVAGVVGVILGKAFNKKIIISTHSIYHFPKSGSYTKFIKFLFSKCDYILTLSKQSKDEVISLGTEINKVGVFTYWVDQVKFSPKEKNKILVKKYNLEDKFTCLFVGRLVKEKGIVELLDCTKYLKPDTKILIAGDGPLTGYVDSIAKDSKRILFLGKINNDLLPEYYNLADIFIIPSMHEEGFGRVILESLSCGTPVLGSNHGAIPTIINSKVGKVIVITPSNIVKNL